MVFHSGIFEEHNVCLEVHVSICLLKFHLISLYHICFVHRSKIVKGKSNIRSWMIQRKLPTGSKIYTGEPKFLGAQQEKRVHLFSK